MAQSMKKTEGDRVLKDITYVQNFKPVALNAIPLKVFSTMKIIKPISLNVYPEIYGYIVRKFEREEAIQKLKHMGYQTAKYLYSLIPKRLIKKESLFETFTTFAKHNSGEKLQLKNIIKHNKVIKSCTIRKYKCIFCTGATIPENVDIPFCYPSAAFYQHFYNLKSISCGNLKPRLVNIEVIKTAKDNKDYCEYQLEALD